MHLAWNSTLHSRFPSLSAPASLWSNSNTVWCSGFYHRLATIASLPAGKDSTALFSSRPQVTRTNPKLGETHQKEGRCITEQRNRVSSHHFSLQLPICSLDINLDTVPQEGFYEALEFCVSAIGSALPPANN